MENSTKVNSGDYDTVLTLIQQLNSKFECLERDGDITDILSQSESEFERCAGYLNETMKREKPLLALQRDPINNSSFAGKPKSNESKEVYVIAIELFSMLLGFSLKFTVSKLTQLLVMLDVAIRHSTKKAFPDANEEINWRRLFTIFKQNFSLRSCRGSCLHLMALALLSVCHAILFVFSFVIKALLFKLNVPEIL